MKKTSHAQFYKAASLVLFCFLCFINDFPNATILLIFLFADDTTCLSSGKNLSNLIDLVNYEIQKMALWYKANKMAVNTSKTKYIIFHNKGKKIDCYKQLLYNCNELDSNNPSLIFPIERISLNYEKSEDKTYKLLGVYFDENLNFNRHSENICSKLSKAIFFLQRSKNFISKKALLSLYYALFHPHLLYCINITSCTSNTNINKILLLQKKPLGSSHTPTTETTQHPSLTCLTFSHLTNSLLKQNYVSCIPFTTILLTFRSLTLGKKILTVIFPSL